MVDVQMIDTTGGGNRRRNKSTNARNHQANGDGGYGTDFLDRQRTQGVQNNSGISPDQGDKYGDYENLNEEFGGNGSDSGK